MNNVDPFFRLKSPGFICLLLLFCSQMSLPSKPLGWTLHVLQPLFPIHFKWHSNSSKTWVLLKKCPSKAKSVRRHMHVDVVNEEAYYLPTWVSKTFAQKSLFATVNTRNIYRVTKTNWVSHEACMSFVDNWERHFWQIYSLSPVACDWKLSLFANANWFDKPLQ